MTNEASLLKYNRFFMNDRAVIEENSPTSINPNSASDKLNHFVGESVPIIDKNNKILGIISENDVLKAYSEITEKIRKIEKN